MDYATSDLRAERLSAAAVQVATDFTTRASIKSETTRASAATATWRWVVRTTPGQAVTRAK